MNSNEETQTNQPEKKCRRWKIPFFILGIILIKGVVFLLIWNAIIPDLFHGPIINFGHAIGLLILAKLAFGMGPHHQHRFGGHFGPFGHHGRWKHMSDEEREKLRSALKHRC